MQQVQYLTIPVMKKPYLLILALIILSASSYSQDVIRLESCSNGLMNKQVDSLKEVYSKDGYELLKEASIKIFAVASN